MNSSGMTTTDPAFEAAETPSKENVKCIVPSRLACCLKYSLAFVLGLVAGLGIVAIVLHDLGMIGGETPLSGFAAEIDLGTLPLPLISPNFLSIDLCFSPIPAASDYNPAFLVVSTLAAGSSWVVAGNTSYDDSRQMRFRVDGLEAGSLISIKYQVGFADQSLSSSSDVIVVATKSAVAPAAPSFWRHLATADSAGFVWFADANSSEAYGTETSGYVVESVMRGVRTVTEFAASDRGVKFTEMNARESVSARVAAKNEVGLGQFSEAVTFTTNAASNLAVPGPVVGLAVTAGYSSANVSWSAPLDTNTGSDLVYYEITLNGEWVKRVSADVTICTVVGLKVGTDNVITVAAVNSVGPGAASGESVATDANCLPDAPVNVGVRYRWLDSVSVAWAQPSSPQCPSAISTSRVVASDGTILCTGGADYCDLTALAPGQSYSIRVQSTNAAGWGALSAPISVTLPTLAGGYQGQCGSWADGRYFVPSTNYNPQVFTVGIQSSAMSALGRAGPAASNLIKFTDNRRNKPATLQNLPKLSSGCAQCFGESVACGKAHCSTACQFGRGNHLPACLQCTAQHCIPALMACAAFDMTFASNQMPPNPVAR